MKTIMFQLKANNILKNIISNYVDKDLKYGWKSSIDKNYDYGHWNNTILNGSIYEPFDHSLMPYISKHKEINFIWEYIKNILGERLLLRCYINAYTFGTDAYAHFDDIWITKSFGSNTLSETVIIYLNEKWDIDWAGETVIFNDEKDIETAVLPKFGRTLIFNSNKLHAARPVTRTCPSLRSVLVFKTGDVKISSKKIKFLLDYTKNIPHLNKSFFEHLFNTMLKLEKNKVDYDVCKAGLFHAIYSTEFFNAGLKIERKVVIDLIGEYSESLVYEFCSVKNRFETLVKNLKNYDNKFRKDLLLIERANLADQNLDGKYTLQINILTEEINKINNAFITV